MHLFSLHPRNTTPPRTHRNASQPAQCLLYRDSARSPDRFRSTAVGFVKKSPSLVYEPTCGRRDYHGTGPVTGFGKKISIEANQHPRIFKFRTIAQVLHNETYTWLKDEVKTIYCDVAVNLNSPTRRTIAADLPLQTLSSRRQIAIVTPSLTIVSNTAVSVNKRQCNSISPSQRRDCQQTR
ncbi:hypothetical protein QL285_032342 [Trifolium repens]|nr:hypothetical protein QL285_032342 [Trifolium repens]